MTQPRPVRKTLILIAALALIAAAGCSNGDDGMSGDGGEGGTVVAPASWAGTWDLTITTRDCVTNEVLDVTMETDVLCAGETVSYDFEEFGTAEIACSGNWSDTSGMITCKDQVVSGGFACDVDVLITASRPSADADTYTVTTRADVSCTGAEGDFDICVLQTVEGVRTSTSQAGCTGSARSALVGSLYRAIDAGVASRR